MTVGARGAADRCSSWDHGSTVVVRGADALWLEDRAIAAAASVASWRSCDLSRLDLRGRDFRGAYLAGVQLDGADLTGAWFDRCVLARASLDGCLLDGVRARGADLRRVRATGVRAEGADFSAALLDDADFTAASLGVSWFRGASTRGTSFRCADLWGARGLDGERDLASPNAAPRVAEYTVKDADGRTLGVLAAPDWQTALYRLVRARGYRGLSADLERGCPRRDFECEKATERRPCLPHGR